MPLRWKLCFRIFWQALNKRPACVSLQGRVVVSFAPAATPQRHSPYTADSQKQRLVYQACMSSQRFDYKPQLYCPSLTRSFVLRLPPGCRVTFEAHDENVCHRWGEFFAPLPPSPPLPWHHPVPGQRTGKKFHVGGRCFFLAAQQRGKV